MRDGSRGLFAHRVVAVEALDAEGGDQGGGAAGGESLTMRLPAGWSGGPLAEEVLEHPGAGERGGEDAALAGERSKVGGGIGVEVQRYSV